MNNQFITRSFSDFYQIIAKNELSPWLESLPAYLSQWLKSQNKSQLTTFENSLSRLPNIAVSQLDLTNGVIAKSDHELASHDYKMIEQVLMSLCPWRKGPFDLFDLKLDAEWRSDFKWDRLTPFIDDLAGKTVLDVGCNSGYHLFRMLGAKAKLAVGIDPMLLFLCQFLTIKELIGKKLPAYFIPMGIEQMPALNAFDTVFSMGVLYHRRSPLEHIYQLKNQLKTNGQLVLETLVVEGDLHHVFMPYDRYAKMKNVYFIPSVKTMIHWLCKCGFRDVKAVDVSLTTCDEQRKTKWIQTESLSDFLDPNDHTKTIEGHDAPMRAVFTAVK